MDAADTFILAACSSASGLFGWLLCDARWRARRERSRYERDALLSWADRAALEAELEARADVNRLDWSSPVVLANAANLLAELGFTAPVDASSIVDASPVVDGEVAP